MKKQVVQTTNALALFETDKAQRKAFADDVISKVLAGNTDALKIQLQLKCAEDIVKQITGNDEFKSCLIDAADKYGSKAFQYMNATFQKREAGVKYDYSNCNDPVLLDLQKQADEIGEKLKARQKLLQSFPVQGMVITDETTGEICTVYPPSKSSSTTIAVTLS
jgi:hypothetical protein